MTQIRSSTATSIPQNFPVLEIFIGIAALGTISWLAWQTLHLNAEIDALQEQLLKAEALKDKIVEALEVPDNEIESALTHRMYENREYATAVQESLDMWQRAPDEMKSALESRHIPILSVDPQNPAGVMRQLSGLTHHVYDCYEKTVRLGKELDEWREREGYSRLLAESRHFEVTNAISEINVCKNSLIEELERLRKENEAALRLNNEEHKSSLRSCEEKRDTTIQLCDEKREAAEQSCNERRDAAVASCEKQRREQLELCEQKREKRESEFQVRLDANSGNMLRKMEDISQLYKENAELQSELEQVREELAAYKNSWLCRQLV